MIPILIRFLVSGGSFLASRSLAMCSNPQTRSFAGLFGAAPSVALATLGLTVATEGPSYAAPQAR